MKQSKEAASVGGPFRLPTRPESGVGSAMQRALLEQQPTLVGPHAKWLGSEDPTATFDPDDTEPRTK